MKSKLTSKRAYKKPGLKTHGNIEQLTQGRGGPPIVGSGGGPPGPPHGGGGPPGPPPPGGIGVDHGDP